ncbi:MAG: hypothetical protein QOG64_887 [Acidimicrobiaceae bacterium]|nr:hypothetical protein [Acidimicrobiaceae bacterium]
MRKALVSLIAMAVLAVSVLAVFGASAASAAPSDCTTSWASPHDGDWSDFANWTAGVPFDAAYACLSNLGAPYRVSITQSVVGIGNLYIADGATLWLTGGDSGTVLTTSGSIVNEGGIDVDQAPSATSGIVSMGAPLSDSGWLEATAGTVSVPQLTVASGFPMGSVLVQPGATMLVTTLTNLSGTTLSGGDYNIKGTLQVTGADVRTLAHAQILLAGSFLGDANISALSRLSSIDPLGALGVGRSVGDVKVEQLTNAGEVVVESGSTLVTHGDYVQAGSGQTQLWGGAIRPLTGRTRVLSGGVLAGEGTVVGSLFNDGRTGAGSGFGSGSEVLHVSGNYSPTTSSTTAVAASCYGSGQLAVDGLLTIGGTLRIDTDKCPPLRGADLPVLTRQTPGVISGQFSAVFGAGYTVNYLSTSVNVRVADIADDNGSRVTYGGWQPMNDSTAPFGVYASSSTAGDTATELTEGTAVTWTIHVGPDQGKARVYLDGVDKGVVDAYASTPGFHTRTYSGLPSAVHTLTVKVTGTQRLAATGHAIGYASQRGLPAVNWSGWGFSYEEDASAATIHLNSGTRHTPVTFAFQGQSVKWVNRVGPGEGRARVRIDGLDRGVVDLYAASAADQHITSFSNLGPGPHTIVVTPTGTKNLNAIGTEVTIDAFVAGL